MTTTVGRCGGQCLSDLKHQTLGPSVLAETALSWPYGEFEEPIASQVLFCAKLVRAFIVQMPSFPNMIGKCFGQRPCSLPGRQPLDHGIPVMCSWSSENDAYSCCFEFLPLLLGVVGQLRFESIHASFRQSGPAHRAMKSNGGTRWRSRIQLRRD